jgi:hypothetical protein
MWVLGQQHAQSPQQENMNLTILTASAGLVNQHARIRGNRPIVRPNPHGILAIPKS